MLGTGTLVVVMAVVFSLLAGAPWLLFGALLTIPNFVKAAKLLRASRRAK